jgi:hypothetical protein
MKSGIYWISSYKFNEGLHSLLSFDIIFNSKSLPSANDGEQNYSKLIINNYSFTLVRVIIRGGWKGNLSFRRMSKLSFSMFLSSRAQLIADLSISN